MRRGALLALLLATLAGAGAGAGAAGGSNGGETDFVVAEGKLSNQDFYRLVSCRAPPGGPCAVDPIAWPPARARALTVTLAEAPPGYPRDMAFRVGRALDRAIGEINGAGAALHLTRAPKGASADVAIHLAPVREGDAIEGTGIPGVDGEVIGAALVTVWWDEAMALTDAVIVVASDLAPGDVEPVILEELTQAMGLMTDIRDPWYEGVSVFSEDSNAATRLSDDALITRLTTIRGVGRWTVEMLLMHTLGRPDILPVDDFGVREGYRLLHNLDTQPKPRDLATLGQIYAPHRTTAAWYLWRAVDQAKAAKA